MEHDGATGQKLILRHSPMKLLNCHLHLQSGQMRAEASVGTRAKGHVSVGGAIKDHFVRSVELFWIPCRQDTGGKNAVSLTKFDAVELHVTGRRPDGAHEGVIAEKFLNGWRNERWVLNELTAVFRMGGQVVEGERQCRCHGVEAGEEEQPGHVEHLV